jgi:hypothetical protein
VTIAPEGASPPFAGKGRLRRAEGCSTAENLINNKKQKTPIPAVGEGPRHREMEENPVTAREGTVTRRLTPSMPLRP